MGFTTLNIESRPISEKALKDFFLLGIVTRAVIEQTPDGKYIFSVYSNSTLTLGEYRHRLFSVRHKEREFSSIDNLVQLIKRSGMSKRVPIELKLDFLKG